MNKTKFLLVILLFLCVISFDTYSQGKVLKGNALFGNLRARQIGPAVMSGRISDIEVVNSKPEIVYIGTASGGIWKSNSAGAIMSPVFDDYTMSIGKIIVDQNHPDTVWVGTGETWVRNSVSVGTGIYKSINGGTTWESKGLESSERISDIIINPDNPDIVIVGVMGQLWNANEERGVYKTEDGGVTWEKALYVDQNTGCADLAIDPDNPEILYASMWDHRREPDFFTSGGPGSGLYKSIDGGKSWSKIHTGLPDETLGRMAVSVAPSNAGVVYISVEVKDKNKKGLYKSFDSGANWKRINGDFNSTVRPFYFSNITVDPTNDSIIFKCGLDLTISKDGGDSFRTVSSGIHSDIHDVWVDPNNNKHIIIGTDGGVYESLDGGYTFKMFMNLPVSQFYHVSVDMEEPFNVYGGLQDNGSWYAPSRNPGGIQNQDWKMTYGGDGFYSFRHPVDKDIIYTEYQGGEILRYNKKSGQAKSIKPYPEDENTKLRFNWNAPIHLSPNNNERMYFGSQFLFMTEDRGESWSTISPDLTTNNPERQRQKKSGGLSIDNSTAENNTTIYTIAESPADEKVIWVGTDDGNLQLTHNSGQSWTNMVANIDVPDGTWISFVEASIHSRERAYVTFDGHRAGDMKPYLFVTHDLGKTWTKLVTEDIEGYCLSVREDLMNPDLIFLGTEFGLYVTIDGGKNWARFKNNLPKVGIRDMVIHSRDNSLVMATHGRGVIILDDITPLRKLTPEVIAKKIHFFKTEPTLLKDPGSGSNWFGGAGHYVGPNPSESAEIIYYMSKRHTFGKMFLEIYDEDGKFIRDLPAGKSGGLNIVSLPIRSDKPKAPPTNNRMALAGSLFGPALPAGKYTVKMTKGKETFESSFELIYDPKSQYSVDERKIQYEYTILLYDMSESLAYIYYALGEITNQGQKLAGTNQKLKKKLESLAEEAEKFAGSLVSLGGDFYVDEEEEQLGELVSQLYRYISTFPGRPSDSQIKRALFLEEKMDEVIERFEDLDSNDLQKINEKLTKLGSDPISFQTKDEFLED